MPLLADRRDPEAFEQPPVQRKIRGDDGLAENRFQLLGESDGPLRQTVLARQFGMPFSKIASASGAFSATRSIDSRTSGPGKIQVFAFTSSWSS